MTTFTSPVMYVFLFGLLTAMSLYAPAVYRRLQTQITAWTSRQLDRSI
jgi:hypothetical protein